MSFPSEIFSHKMDPEDKTTPIGSIFTYNKDVDLLILAHLDDKSLCCVHQVNKYGESLCVDDRLWKIKILKFFSEHLHLHPQTKTLDQYLEFVNTKYANFTWKQRYLEFKFPVFKLSDQISAPRQMFTCNDDDEISIMHSLRTLPYTRAITTKSVITWRGIEPRNPPNISDYD